MVLVNFFIVQHFGQLLILNVLYKDIWTGFGLGGKCYFLGFNEFCRSTWTTFKGKFNSVLTSCNSPVTYSEVVL